MSCIFHTAAGSILSEIYNYVHQNPPPEDSDSTKLMLAFLEACNKIFEKRLLTHDKVTTCESQVLTNIQEGYLNGMMESMKTVCTLIYRACMFVLYFLLL